ISGAMANHARKVPTNWVVTLGGNELPVRIEVGEGDTLNVVFDDGTVAVSSDWLPGRNHASFLVDGERIGVKTASAGQGWRLRWRGIDEVARVRTPRIAELARLMPEKLPPDTSKMLLCPMPGVITSVAVKVGDTVEDGQVLCTVEAMKMENVLRAERRGVVKSISAEPGMSLAVDELIMEFE